MHIPTYIDCGYHKYMSYHITIAARIKQVYDVIEFKTVNISKRTMLVNFLI